MRSSTGTAGRQDRNSLDIVIYEEDFLTRSLLQEWLSEAGHQVRFGRAHDPQLDYPADVVIAAVYNPKNTGAQWVCAVRAAHPETPIIAISGQFRSGLCAGGATAHSLGARTLIAKPLSRTALLGALRRMIGATDQQDG
jgi:DNA-binding NtrC family response regulator